MVDSLSQFLVWARKHDFGLPEVRVTLIASPRTHLTVDDLFWMSPY